MDCMILLSQPGRELSPCIGNAESLTTGPLRDVPTIPFKADFPTVGTEASGIPSKC